nr:hypothetical protein [Tanacetum cinerariifolium]
YENVKELRYGHLMIMADQDHDGKVGKRCNKIQNEVLQGREACETEEVAEYFADLDNYTKNFFWDDDKDDYAIERAFRKKKIRREGTCFGHISEGTGRDSVEFVCSKL